MVPDQVNRQAKIMIVGEMPSRDEIAYRRYLAGDAGWKLEEWLKNAGIKRSDTYITKILPESPGRQYEDIDDACKRDRGLSARIRDVEYPRVQRIAESLPSLELIVTLGEYATHCFTRYGMVQWNSGNAGVASVRGSVYEWNGRYVIPTLLPGTVYGQPELERRCIADWKRISRVATQGFQRPVRRHIIYPDLSDINKWANNVCERDAISYDIETWGGEIKCIGFAVSPSESITIPTTHAEWLTIEGSHAKATQGLAKAWDAIRGILESDNDKVGQNSLFDQWWLAQPEYNIRVRNSHWDTMAMHHAIVPNESHSLDFLASIYTDEPYWKDEAKDADAIIKVARTGMDRLYVYNGLDVAVTHEIFTHLFDTLDGLGRMGFYLDHYADVSPILLDVMMKGALVDRGVMNALRAKFLVNALRHRDEASLEAGRALFRFDSTSLGKEMIADYYVNGPGMPLGETPKQWLQHFADREKVLKSGVRKPMWKVEDIEKRWAELQDKGISDTELAKLLFDEWHCPSTGSTEGGKHKVDNIALKGLRNLVEERKRGEFIQNKERIIRTIDLALSHRRERKLATFVDDTRLDTDSRMRCTYKYNTKTGRLASASNPRGTGTNLQNQDRAIRSIFIASPGRILIECDLSQAEGRVVRCLSGDPEAIRLARRLPTEGDEHTENAVKIFSAFYKREVTPAEIKATKGTGQDLRQIGKRVVHAGNYDQGKVGLSNTLLKDGFAMTIYECGKLIESHRENNPYVELYQSAVRRRIIKDRGLYTSWGRHISFEDIRVDPALFRFGYSYVPQSEVGDLTNQKGLKYVGNLIRSERLDSDLILQVHDSVVLDAVPSEVYFIMSRLKASMEAPRTYGGCFGQAVELSIPVEFKLGLKWGEGREYKAMPTEDEVNDYVRELCPGA